MSIQITLTDKQAKYLTCLIDADIEDTKDDHMIWVFRTGEPITLSLDEAEDLSNYLKENLS